MQKTLQIFEKLTYQTFNNTDQLYDTLTAIK
jgi:hypothetical protein